MREPWPDPEDAVTLPVDDLGLRMLERIVEQRRPLVQRTAFLNEILTQANIPRATQSVYDTTPGAGPVHLAQALAEAWDWLVTQGLLAEASAQMFAGVVQLHAHFFVTRFGRAVAGQKDARAWVAGQRRLGLELHPRLERRARRQFLLGEFELAAFAALREVEIAVREATGLAGLYGTGLMDRAFAPGTGPLTDSSASRAEQQGIQGLFRSALATFKNPASHRSVRFDDPTEAAEIVLFADLLLRIVDRVQTPR